jgi:hypothetical protein
MKLLIRVALATVLILAVGSTIASASRSLEFSTRAISASWENLVFGSSETESPVVCRAAFALALSSQRIAKVNGTQIGTTSATVTGVCTGGSIVMLAEGRQRWPLVYQGFNGTLPNITGILVDIQSAEFLLVASGGFERCLFRGTAKGIMDLGAGGSVTGITASPTALIPLSVRLRGALFCRAVGWFSGTSTVTPATTVRLL